jgi:hypothetical protein
MTIGEVIKKSESQGGPRVYYILNIFIKFIINKGTPSLSRELRKKMTAGKNPRNFKKKGQKKKV